MNGPLCPAIALPANLKHGSVQGEGKAMKYSGLPLGTWYTQASPHMSPFGALLLPEVKPIAVKPINNKETEGSANLWNSVNIVY